MRNIFTKEQVDKIEVGKIYTSWKQLCEEAGIPYKKGGKNQEYQKLELFRFFDYEKQGRKYIMLAKREIPLLKMASTKSPYRKILQLLILDLISNCKDEKLSLTQDNLFILLSMVNEDFKLYRKDINKDKLSKELDIKKVTIDIFYNRHSSRFRDIITGTLNSLKNQFLIDWDLKTRMAFADGSNEVMNDIEKKILLSCKSDIAEILGIQSEQDAYINGRYLEFMQQVVLEYNSRMDSDVKFFYTTYDIIYNTNKNFIDKKKRKIHDELEEDYKIILQKELNGEIVKSTIENVKNRTTNMLYIDNEIKLTERLIKL